MKDNQNKGDHDLFLELIAGFVTCVIEQEVAMNAYEKRMESEHMTKKSYEIKNRTISLPENLNTKQHVIAFNHVGRYVTDATTPDTMRSFRDPDLESFNPEKDFHFLEGISLDIWHEVLSLYESKGIIAPRWSLDITKYAMGQDVGFIKPYWNFTVQWNSQGNRIEIPGQNEYSAWVKKLDYGDVFDPTALTHAQKAKLIGKPYATRMKLSDDPVEKRILEESDFTKLYYRKREYLTEEQNENGFSFLKDK